MLALLFITLSLPTTICTPLLMDFTEKTGSMALMKKDDLVPEMDFDLEKAPLIAESDDYDYFEKSEFSLQEEEIISEFLDDDDIITEEHEKSNQRKLSRKHRG